MVHARLTPMPLAAQEQWREARRGGPGELPEPRDVDAWEALVVVVDDDPVGRLLVTGVTVQGRRRCSVSALETDLPSDATEEWAAVLTVVADHVRDGGADSVVTSVPFRLAPVFEAAGFRATGTLSAVPDADTPVEDDEPVAVRPMGDAERRRFARALHRQLAEGGSSAVRMPGTADDEVADRLARLAGDPVPDDELLLTGTVDDETVGRVWGTLVERDDARAFIGHVVELYPDDPEQQVGPRFVHAIAHHLQERDVRDVRLRLPGGGEHTLQTLLGGDVSVTDVDLHLDLTRPVDPEP